jgi:hypothetical protein
MTKYTYVIFLLLILLATNVNADQDWDNIKNHGPHAGFVKMNKDKTLGLEVISLHKGQFRVFVLASNYGPFTSNDIKVTASHSGNQKNKNVCAQKDDYFDCKLSDNIDDQELIFHILSNSPKVDEEFSIKLP